MENSTNNVQLAFDVAKGLWLLDGAEHILPTIARLSSGAGGPIEAIRQPIPNYLTLDSEHLATKSSKAPQQGCVALIRLGGTLTKYPSWATAGTAPLATIINELALDKRVAALIIDIDSNGGAVNAVPVLVAALRNFKAQKKPILAHCDCCASAAYWIASQCDKVFADNTLSRVGSIGAMCECWDDRGIFEQDGGKVHTVYAVESPDKNADYRSMLDGDYGPIQATLSTIVKQFHTDIKVGRPNLKTDSPGVMTGKTFYAEEAKAVGLIDSICSLDETIKIAYTFTQINR